MYEYKDPRIARQERSGRIGNDYQYPVPKDAKAAPETVNAEREYRDPFRARQDRLGSGR